MSDNNTSGFTPHSDEELARLLEQQMQAMRAAQAQPSQSVASPEPETIPETSSEFVLEQTAESVEDDGIDSLFGALLDDSVDEVAEPEVAPEIFVVPEPVSYDNLDHTQPISYIPNETVEEVVVEEVTIEEIIVEQTSDGHIESAEIAVEAIVVEEVIEVEPLSEDPHDVASRVLNEISADGAVAATTVAATAAANPIPQMFGEVPEVVSPEVVAPVPVAAIVEQAPPVSYEPQNEVEEAGVEYLSESQQILRLKPVNSVAPKLSFDELVFGFNQED